MSAFLNLRKKKLDVMVTESGDDAISLIFVSPSGLSHDEKGHLLYNALPPELAVTLSVAQCTTLFDALGLLLHGNNDV